MKANRYVSVLLAAAMLFVMGSCVSDDAPDFHEVRTGAAPAAAEPAVSAAEPDGVQTAAAVQTVLGYAAEEIPSPDWVLDFGVCDIYNETFYIAAAAADGGAAVAGFDTRTEQFERYDIDVGTLHNPHTSIISAAENSLWLFIFESWTAEELEQGLYTGETNLFLLYRNLITGEQRISPVLFWEETSPPLFLLALDDGRALAGNHDCKTKTYLFDKDASLIEKPDMIVHGMGVRAWVNDRLYVQTPDGLAELDRSALKFGAPIEEIYDQPAVYSSSRGHFLTTTDNTFYSVDADTGEKTEIFNWMDVALSFSRLYGNSGLENENGDYFHYTDRITKITMAEIPEKQTLILACLGDSSSFGYPVEGENVFAPSNKTYICSDSLMDAIIRFNNSDPEYKIAVRPYIYANDEERTRLLIELATGKGADILDTSLLPDGAADGSILVDMLPYLDADEDIGRDDFIPGIFADMTKNGGLYEYIERYNLITMTTRSGFAAGGEWTVGRIQQILALYPELRVQNDTEKLCDYFSWAASAEFMDYDGASCYFTDGTFEEWLVLLRQLCQTDRDWDSDKYLGEYAIYIDTEFPCSIGNTSRRRAGGEYIPAGFPDSSGTGSYFMRFGPPTAYGSWSFMPNGERSYSAVSSVGIMASSDKQYGAWRFIKTFMTCAENTALTKGIPAKKASFEQALENALAREQSASARYEEFGESDADHIRYLVYNTSECVSDSSNAAEIIRAALSAYIGGVYSAEDTASQLQSRMSIYLSEQQ